MDRPEEMEQRLMPCSECGMVANTRRDCVVLCPDNRLQAIHEVCLYRCYKGLWPVWVNRTSEIHFSRLREIDK